MMLIKEEESRRITFSQTNQMITQQNYTVSSTYFFHEIFMLSLFTHNILFPIIYIL
jgi:hypothetical protein